MSENSGSVHNITASSLTASHPAVVELPVFVGPSTAKEFNTLRSRLTPKACFKLEDNNFEFDSSFITVLTFDAGPLKNLLEKHSCSKLSIFGHADPVGREDYNKTLSGRRAQAIYGLLVRDVKLWEDLYFHHDKLSGKDEWGVRSVKLMLNRVGPTKTGSITGELDPAAKQALHDFEEQQNLPPKGFNAKKEVAPETFRSLASIYMDAICRDDDNQDFRLKPEDFLARGLGNDGKGDYQGCGEFNPLMIFSKDEQAFFDKEANHNARNKENQTNRRVLILLFRPGSQVDPGVWPCPSAKQGSDGCRLRFFSDADQRRSNQGARRTFEESRKDPSQLSTFSCRFYERVLTSSPCERIVGNYMIRLFDKLARPLPGAPCAVYDGKVHLLRADDDGFVTIRIDGIAPESCIVKWSPQKTGDDKNSPLPSVADDFEFEVVVFVTIHEENEDAAAVQRLHNLGYAEGPALEDDVGEFQKHYKLDERSDANKPFLGPKTKAKLKEVYDSCNPAEKPPLE